MVTPARTSVRVDRLRALNVPRTVTVETSADGLPVTIGAAADAQQVDTVLEVWRIDDEWWRTPITRRYVDVVLEGGAHVVLFEDLHTGAWFVQQP